MPDRKRSNTGQFVETVTLEAVLGVFDRVDGPVITSSDVAAALDCTTEAARQKLTRLYDQGEVDKRKTGRTVVYWRTDDRAGRTSAKDGPQRDESASHPDAGPSAGGGEDTDERPDPAALEAVEFPSGRDRDECVAAVRAARDYLREEGPATMREIVAEVMPEHPLGYDVDDALEKVEAGDRYRGAWWRRVVKPGLKALPDVEAPAQGASEWREVQT